MNDENHASTSTADDKHLMDGTNSNDNNKMPLNTSVTGPPSSSGNVNSLSEPIYAVVDLKNKYARRKMREMENENAIDSQPERPRSFHVGSSDYEEVRLYTQHTRLMFCMMRLPSSLLIKLKFSFLFHCIGFVFIKSYRIE